MPSWENQEDEGGQTETLYSDTILTVHTAKHTYVWHNLLYVTCCIEETGVPKAMDPVKEAIMYFPAGWLSHALAQLPWPCGPGITTGIAWDGEHDRLEVLCGGFHGKSGVSDSPVLGVHAVRRLSACSSTQLIHLNHRFTKRSTHPWFLRLKLASYWKSTTDTTAPPGHTGVWHPCAVVGWPLSFRMLIIWWWWCCDFTHYSWTRPSISTHSDTQRFCERGFLAHSLQSSAVGLQRLSWWEKTRDHTKALIGTTAKSVYSLDLSP